MSIKAQEEVIIVDGISSWVKSLNEPYSIEEDIWPTFGYKQVVFATNGGWICMM